MMAQPAMKAALVAAVLAVLAAPAAQANPAKVDAGKLRSKCTVINVVLGTSWDVLGGSSDCSMLSGKKPAGNAASKQQNASNIRAKDKSK